MNVRKYRWSRVYESAEEELLSFLEAKHITAERREAEDGKVFAPHTHAHDKRLWCVEGSIVFLIIDGGRRISLQPGDTLDIPAGTAHEAEAGISGCIYYESPAPAQNPMIPMAA
jgi:quercetin dioxygenase-like cupin family protein